jgi:HEAT repeat protein
MGSMSENELQVTLQELIAARRETADHAYEYYVEKMCDLAEVGYPPAMDFFLECLDDPRWNWRYNGLCNLGFHYVFPPDSPLVEKIRQLLLTDPHSWVRDTAASVLGSRSSWPDMALVSALESDMDEQVRYSAFDALLRLARVPFAVASLEVERVEKKAIPPSMEEIIRILAEAGLDSDLLR